jgi:lipopolysaccharide transport system permease protein
MIEALKDLVRHRDLLYMLTWKEVRIRYKQSVMGFLWALLMPLMIVSAGVLMKQAYALSTHKYVDMQDVLSVSVKAVLWAFFVSAVKFGSNSLIANTNLVTKIYFPREVLPLACVFANFFDFLIAAGFLSALVLVAHVALSLQLLWVPLIVGVLVTITVGASVLLSCANLFFRDVKYIVEVVFTYGILFTPVLYSARTFGKWAPALLLNPVGSVMESINDVVVLRQPPNLIWLGYAAASGVASVALAWLIFKKAEPSFAQEI